MNLVKFIDNRFQELRMVEQEQDARKEYSLIRDSEVLALKAVLQTWRVIFKYLMIPKILLHYFGCSLGFIKKPEPVLLQKMEAQRDAELKEKNKKAEKLGFKPTAVPAIGEQPVSH